MCTDAYWMMNPCEHAVKGSILMFHCIVRFKLQYQDLKNTMEAEKAPMTGVAFVPAIYRTCHLNITQISLEWNW